MRGGEGEGEGEGGGRGRGKGGEAKGSGNKRKARRIARIVKVVAVPLLCTVAQDMIIYLN